LDAQALLAKSIKDGPINVEVLDVGKLNWNSIFLNETYQKNIKLVRFEILKGKYEANPKEME
jgi:hypothetical protein